MGRPKTPRQKLISAAAYVVTFIPGVSPEEALEGVAFGTGGCLFSDERQACRSWYEGAGDEEMERLIQAVRREARPEFLPRPKK